MTIEQCLDEPQDKFPVGMRVLAVDDDPICLRVLDTLLRKCQYHVTTTNQAVTALKLLRENKNKFDLVISDVHMPDMDGFRLLELVGLEMDLPVIMLSANGDTRLVMKGITHGACDYLLKPVRIEELKNIWTHVLRRKKLDSKDQNNSDKACRENEGGQVVTVTGDSDQKEKMSRKRKDQNEDEDEDRVDNGNNNEDSSTQKKPRVVWTVDLHRKFVAAVNQLGMDKAVPKRILDMMNVEKLTRENVASHLQKYRLYLKRISSVASHQANMVAALGGADSPYLRMGSLNGFGNGNNLAGLAQFQNADVRSLPSSGMLGRLNTPTGLGMRGLSSPRMGQLGRVENLSNPFHNQSKFGQVILPGNQNGNIFQGMPTSFEFDQLQRNRCFDTVGDFSNATNDSTVFPIANGIVPYNPMMLQGQPQEIASSEVGGNQSCVTVASSNTEFSSHLPDFSSNSFVSSDCFEQDTSSYYRNNKSSVATPQYNKSLSNSSITSVPTGFPVLRTDLHCQAAPRLRSNAPQDMNFTPNLMCSSMNSTIPPHGVMGPFNQRVDANNIVCNGSNDFNSRVGRPNVVDPLTMQHNEVEQSAIGTPVKLKQEYVINQGKPQDGYSFDDVGSLEDLVSGMMKQDEDKLFIEDGDFDYEL